MDANETARVATRGRGGESAPARMPSQASQDASEADRIARLVTRGRGPGPEDELEKLMKSIETGIVLTPEQQYLKDLKNTSAPPRNIIPPTKKITTAKTGLNMNTMILLGAAGVAAYLLFKK